MKYQKTYNHPFSKETIIKILNYFTSRPENWLYYQTGAYVLNDMLIEYIKK
jgi:hypothetical protein